MTTAERQRHLLVILLTLGTGAIDATCFLHLGGAFSSVMTGNMVLLGLSLAGSPHATAWLVATAIVAYIAGVTLGAWLAGRRAATDSVWPTRVTITLATEAALLLILSTIWALTDAGRTAPGAAEVMLTLAAVALGIQSSAVQRFGVTGLSSTYLTGTLTTIVAAFASRRPFRQQLPGIGILLALIAGAAAGYLVDAAARGLFTPAIICGPIIIVLAAALLIRWEDDRRLLGRHPAR